MSGDASKKVVWIQQLHMGSVDDSRKPEAQRLLASYRAFYGLEGEYIAPVNYQWISTPASQYPDSGNEIFNKIPGDSKNFTDREWVGIPGNAELIINLSTRKQINWLGFHVLNNNATGIKFPDALHASCSTDNQTWNSIGDWPLAVPKIDSEYVFSNLAPFSVACQFIKVKLDNTGWTFIGEAEIVSSGSSSLLPGDLNGDGKVNIYDYNQLITDFGKTGSAGFIPADINTDGKVDIYDYNILVGNFGSPR